MFDQQRLKREIHRAELKRLDKLLLVLASEPVGPKTVTAVKATARSVGFRALERWNVSQILATAKALAIRVPAGWEITDGGRRHVESLIGQISAPAWSAGLSNLRDHLSKVADPDAVEFLKEAIACYEARLHRAAVVLTWVGAVHVIYRHVVQTRLADFNTEARRRDAKWRDAKTVDDLSRMKEHDFLDVCDATSVIGKNVKQELQDCLKLRNGCGHPNSLKIAENTVAHHVEILILNVFRCF